MKPGRRSKILGLVLSMVLLVSIAGMPAPALANGGVILHPGDLTGSVTVDGYDITQVTVRAMDTDGVFSAYVSVSVPGGASSIDYTLTVEGDRDYYVIADAQVVATDYTRVIFPVHGTVNVPIGGTVTQNLSVDPAFISGTISTTTDGGNTIQGFNIYAYIWPPEFPGMSFQNRTTASLLTVPGQPGRGYTLLVAPELDYYFYGWVTVNGIQYYFPNETVGPLAAGGTLTKNISIDVTAATISGNATLLGPATDVYDALVRGYAPNPTRYANTEIADIATGAYTLNVDADTWYVHPYFYYHLTGETGETGDLSGLYGFLNPPRTPVTLTAGQHLEDFDFIIDPGFITGTLSLTGASTDIWQYSYIQAYSAPNGYMQVRIHPDTGEYMFVASPGDSWRYNYLYLRFDYPADPDPYLWSYINQSGYFLDPYTVASGETLSDVDATFGTATVRLYYYVEGVEGGGELSLPYYQATKEGLTYPTAYARGSHLVTTEGQAIGTLFPGTWTIEAFATVEDGSVPEFGTFTVTVDEGDTMVIGGLGRPTIQVTSPIDGAETTDDSVFVEGTATDVEGIASITINGEPVTLTPTGGPDNEVSFSHPVSLDVGVNTITIVATDVDPTPHSVTATLTVTRTEVTTATTLTYTGDTSVQVNTPATLSAMLEDGEGQPISGATISFQVDGLDASAVTDTDGVASCEVTIDTVGVYNVTAEFAGDAQHQGSTATASLTVYTPTTLTYTGDTLVQVNGVATLAALLVDEDGQPISDAEITFQVDGLDVSAFTDTNGVASLEVPAPPDAGVFEITADFAGDDLHQASTAATVLGAVYDPEGGFVTGGGWIDSPEGACVAEPTLTGRANFGFVSKYKKGATTPTGQTEFQFQVADLKFHSDTYQWLVVAGARAMYKGTGTINGEGNYGFMLTAIDAKLTLSSTDVDKFRIKIWDRDTDTIVYDNQMDAADGTDPTTSIAGGNIVIHKG